LNWLEHLDRELFLLINQHYNHIFDVIMYWISNRFVWIPMYIVLLMISFKLFKDKIWLMILVVALMIVMSDQFSVLIKNYFQRYRPCHNLELQSMIHLVDGCGGKFGFVSSHAANCFALATFLTLYLRKHLRWFPVFIFFWALLVGYSRVYTAVHYPGDVIGGGILGTGLGYFCFGLYSLIAKKYKLHE